MSSILLQKIFSNEKYKNKKIQSKILEYIIKSNTKISKIQVDKNIKID